MPEVVCIGELLVDLVATEVDVPLARARAFAAAPGGAPANVAVGLARLGVASGFLGAVGRDPFGDGLEEVLREEGVEVSRLVRVEEARTTLAFIAARSDGRKDIAFWRNPGADGCLAPVHVDEGWLRSASALHFGSVSRIDPSPRAATDRARQIAAEAGLLVTHDPNVRPSLWPDGRVDRDRLLEGFEGVAVAKVSEEEWEALTGEEELGRGAATLFDRGVEIVVRSEGEAGASYVTRRSTGHVGAFAVRCVEPTGAGDAAMACLIADLLPPWREGLRPGELGEPDLARLVRRACGAGALACTGLGAIPSLPSLVRLETFLVEAG